MLPKVTSLSGPCGSLIMNCTPLRLLARAFLRRSGAFRCRSASASRQLVSDAPCCAACTSFDGSTGVGSTITSETGDLAPAVLWPSRHLRLELATVEGGYQPIGQCQGGYQPTNLKGEGCKPTSNSSCVSTDFGIRLEPFYVPIRQHDLPVSHGDRPS